MKRSIDVETVAELLLGRLVTKRTNGSWVFIGHLDEDPFLPTDECYVLSPHDVNALREIIQQLLASASDAISLLEIPPGAPLVDGPLYPLLTKIISRAWASTGRPYSR